MKLRNLFAVIGFIAATSVGAQTMKPGLWEVGTKMGGSPEMEQAMAQMQKQIAGMPAAQRKQMEEMMGKQGVGAPGAAGGAIVAKICYTKEMLDRNQGLTQQQGNCTTTTSDKTSTGMKMKYTCTNPASSGEGQITYLSDTAYNLKMTINSASAKGTSMPMTMNTNGKWLSSDCGNIKPMVIPAKP